MKQIEASVPEETILPESAAACWEKPEEVPAAEASYRVFLNGRFIAETSACDYTFRNLSPASDYAVSVYLKESGDSEESAGDPAESGQGNSLFHGLFSRRKKPDAQSGSLSTGFRTPEKNEALSVVNFGGVGDGKTKDTAAIQRAVNACRPWQTVRIPAGRWLSGAIYLRSGVTLCLDEGAVLLGSPDPADYPVREGMYEGVQQNCRASLLNACPEKGERFSGIRITGRGTISGNGSVLGPAEMKQLGSARGRVLYFENTDKIYIDGVTIRESPSWCVHFFNCSDVTVCEARIENLYREDGRLNGLPNNDGFDPECCRNVRVMHTFIQSEDDLVAIKSGRDAAGRALGIPSENIRVSDCEFSNGFGVACGSEMSGGIRNVRVSRCTFRDSFSIASVKCCRGRGNTVENAVFEDCSLVNRSPAYRDCKWFRGAINVDMFYSVEDEEINLSAWQRVTEETPELKNLTFRNLSIDTVGGCAIYLCGLPERHLSDIVLENIDARGRRGMVVQNADGLEIRSVRLTVTGEPED